jgi:hypothetical protein
MEMAALHVLHGMQDVLVGVIAPVRYGSWGLQAHIHQDTVNHAVWHCALVSLCLPLQKAGGMPTNGHLPESLVLSSEVIDSGGVYLLDSGADLLLYVDQEAPDQIVQVRLWRDNA